MSITAVTELWEMGAIELADAIRSGRVSSREVVEAHLRRIEDLNPAINAVPVVLGEQALEAAVVADRATASGGELPPLHGIPFTVKGNIEPRRHADDPWDQGTRGRLSGDGCPGGRADAGRRGNPHRPHQPARLRDRLAHRQRIVGSDRQPMG